MILDLQQRVYHAIDAAVRRRFGVTDVPAFAVETPPDRALGDLAVTAAFQLARALRKPPRAIAQDLAQAVGAIEGVDRVSATSNGYLNVYLDRRSFVIARARGHEIAGARIDRAAVADKTIVEHTAINPNKAAHIGHLRNCALGDTLVRLLRFRGQPVEVQNYIDDTGVQVADVVVGFTHLEGRDLAGVKALADDPAVRFDYYCWDLYARVTEWYEHDKERLTIRNETLHDIEHGGNENAEIGALIAERIVRCHLKTMGRMNVDYDLLTWEGDILRLHFWARAFEELKNRKAVFLQTEGRLKGCWVMPIEDANGDSQSERGGDDDDAEQREKVIVRSNGTVTYVGKDIAYQLWKFGLLGKDFGYRWWKDQGLWTTTAQGAADHPAFGGARAVVNVIDARQSYLQKIVRAGLEALGHAEEAERSVHYAYEMVALSPATARALGVEVEEGKQAEMSGRKGIGDKADDLLDRLAGVQRLLRVFGPFFGLVLVLGLFALMLALKDIADQRTSDGLSGFQGWVEAARACSFDGLNAFVSVRNLKTVLAQTVIVGIGALGMTMIIVSGGIDLSVGSSVALSSVLGALLALRAWSTPWVVLSTVVAGGLIGLVNGSLIAGFRLMPFIVTLGMMGVCRGAAKWFSGSQTVSVPQEAPILNLMHVEEMDRLFPLHLGVWMTLGLALVMSVAMLVLAIASAPNRTGRTRARWPYLAVLVFACAATISLLVVVG